MLIYQLVGAIILFIVCMARVMVAWRKNFLPKRSERFGVATFVLACFTAWTYSIFYAQSGLQVRLAGEPAGLEDIMILKLIRK